MDVIVDLAAVARIILRGAHAVAGAVWLGAGFYLVFALVPLRRTDPAVATLLRAAQDRFRRWWLASNAILVGSGVALMFDCLADGRGTATYVGVLLVKVVAGIVALGASGGLLPRPPRSSRGTVGKSQRFPDQAVLALGALAYLLGV
ncbi:MAG: hypothetical protein NZL87_10215, partial [Thermomicrobium sp.]|nr:hypothetical protein [Thermomicrobium sp.]